jgi:hypothetical protein
MRINFPFIRVADDEDRAKANSQSTQMAAALSRRGITYVRPAASEHARRRAAGKRQRATRRLNRGNKAARR